MILIANVEGLSIKELPAHAPIKPACAKVECGTYECPTPFELKMDSTCCGYCWASDDDVALDRHKSFSAAFKIDQCESAPSSCKSPGPDAVRCFQVHCLEGAKPICAEGTCCPSCPVAEVESLAEEEPALEAPAPEEPAPEA